ncbi:MAG: DUF4358 domain-containing protein [Firmicutes bacterium]|nr:DUF4358 domain-containing protein [Bacillota bacterium]
MAVKREFVKFLLMAVLMVSVVFCMSACGSSKVWTMNLQEMANGILDSVQFDAEMKQVKADSVSNFIELPENWKGYMFMGDGSHSDCFGVFRFNDESDGKSGEKAIKKFLDELEDSFKRYIPEEADKVKSHTYLERKGKNVVFVVSPDEEKAEEVVSAGFMEVEEEEAEKLEQEAQEIIEPEDTEEEENKEETTAETQEEENTEETKTEESKTEETKTKSTKFDLNNYPKIDTNKKLKYSNAIALVGRSAFEIYDYVESTAETYADLVNYTKKKLGEDVNVYDMIIPLSSGITVPNKYYDEIMGSNQRKSLKKLYSKLNKNVIPVNIYETLMQHRDEKIYFRTDHHWTSLGSYYAYTKWCDVSGNLSIPLKGRKKIDMGEFLGTFYNDTKSNALLKHPDKLVAYLPKGKAYVPKKNSEGKWERDKVIYDYSESPSYIKYNAFLGGDKGLVTIVNKGVDDDSVLVIVKESFGNAIAPYFADHYRKVYVIDYRYFDKNIVDFAKKKGADDLIFINNIGMTRSSYLVGLMGDALKR